MEEGGRGRRWELMRGGREEEVRETKKSWNKKCRNEEESGNEKDIGNEKYCGNELDQIRG